MIKLIKDKFNSVFGEVETTEKFNLEFVDKIQPLDNLIYREDYVKKGSGYETCIHIHDYPKNVKNHWLKAISDISLDNITITVDISTMDEYLVNEKLEKDIREKNDRASNSNTVIDRITEKDNLDSSVDLAKKLNSSKILIKLVHIRVFMYANTIKELETEVTKFLNYLKGKQFKGGIFLNELEYEYKSIYNDYTTQAESFFNKRNGKEINSDVLGAGVDFHSTNLSDENGVYFGDTTTGGTVIFNPFLKSDYRKSYNGILIGKMGSGKSTFLKKLSNSQYILGGRVRCFDASGEFSFLVKKANAKMINLNNPENTINPLQIYKSDYINTDKNSNILEIDTSKINLTEEQIQEKFYQNHLSKFGIFFLYYAPDLSEDYIDELTVILDEFYKFKGFYEVIDNRRKFLNITERKAEEYPILSEFLQFVEVLYNVEKDNYRKERIDKIKLKLTKLININGILFNGHSSINLQDEDFVVFNVKDLATLPDNVFSAVIFNILSLLWEETINNVDISKMGKNVKDYKVKYYSIFVDEAHRILNDNLNDKTLKFFIDLQREMRKYMAGIWFSFHTLDDAIKDNAKNDSMKQIFNLSQYKIIFEQDARLKEKYFRVFDGIITESEVDKISRFKIGECLLSTGEDKNIIFKVSLGLDEEKEVIATGGI